MSVRSNTAAQLAQDMQRVGNAAVQAKQTYDKGVLTTIQNKWDQIYTDFKKEIAMSNDFDSYEQIAENYQAQMSAYVDDIKAPSSVRNYLNGTYFPKVKNEMKGYLNDAYVSGYYNDANTRWESYITTVGADGSKTYAEKDNALREYYKTNGIGSIPQSIVRNVTDPDTAIKSMQGISVQQATARYYAENDPASVDFDIEKAVEYALSSITNSDGTSAITDDALRESLEKTARDYIDSTLEANLNASAANAQQMFSDDVLVRMSNGEDFPPEKMYAEARQIEGAVDPNTGTFSRQWTGFMGEYENVMKAINDNAKVNGISEDDFNETLNEFEAGNDIPATVPQQSSEQTVTTVTEDDGYDISSKVTDPDVREGLKYYLNLGEGISVKHTDPETGKKITYSISFDQLSRMISGKLGGIAVTDTGFMYTLDDFIRDYIDTDVVAENRMLSGSDEGSEAGFNQSRYLGDATYSFNDGNPDVISTSYAPVVNYFINKYGIDLNSREAVSSIINLVNAEAQSGRFDSPSLIMMTNDLVSLKNDPDVTSAEYAARCFSYMFKYNLDIEDMKNLGLYNPAVKQFKDAPNYKQIMDDAELLLRMAMYPAKDNKGNLQTWGGTTIKKGQLDGYIKGNPVENYKYNQSLIHLNTLIEQAYYANPSIFDGTHEAEKNKLMDSLVQQVADKDLADSIDSIEKLYNIGFFKEIGGAILNMSVDDIFSQQTDVQAFMQGFYTPGTENYELFHIYLTPENDAKAFSALYALDSGVSWDSDEALDAIANEMFGRSYESLSYDYQTSVKLGRIKATYEMDLQKSLIYAFNEDGVDQANMVRINVTGYGPAYMDSKTGKFYMSDGDSSSSNTYWSGQFDDNDLKKINMATSYGKVVDIYYGDLPETKSKTIDIKRKNLYK